MSANSTRLPLVEARRIAHDLANLLRPACERIAIAGSIRREKADIGDVEIVAIPKIREQYVASADMFGAPATETMNLLDEMSAGLLLRGIFQKRLNKLGRGAWGIDLKWGVYQGFNIDLYSTTADQWACTLAIRTGSAEFSHHLVTPRSQGGFCPSNLEVKGWRVRRRDTHELLETPEEADLFAALGMLCPDPWLRTDTYQPVRLQPA